MRGLPPTTASYLGTASIKDAGPYFNTVTFPEGQSADTAISAAAASAHADGGDGAHHHDAHHHPHHRADDQAGGRGRGDDTSGEHGGRCGPPGDATQGKTTEPPTARRRIRGKSAPISTGRKSGGDDADSVPQAAAAPGVTFEPRGHGIYERVIRTRYRQLDLRALRHDPVREAGYLYAELPVQPRTDEAVRSTQCPPRPSHEFCKPAASSSWTQRLTIVRSSAIINCLICGTGSRSRCAGCGAPCCVGCARARRHCTAANGDPAEGFNLPCHPHHLHRRRPEAPAPASTGGATSSAHRLCHLSEAPAASVSHAFEGGPPAPPPHARAHAVAADDDAAAVPAVLAACRLPLSQGVAVAGFDDAHRMRQQALDAAGLSP